MFTTSTQLEIWTFKTKDLLSKVFEDFRLVTFVVVPSELSILEELDRGISLDLEALTKSLLLGSVDEGDDCVGVLLFESLGNVVKDWLHRFAVSAPLKEKNCC